jgi:hypothetical protein
VTTDCGSFVQGNKKGVYYCFFCFYLQMYSRHVSSDGLGVTEVWQPGCEWSGWVLCIRVLLCVVVDSIAGCQTMNIICKGKRRTVTAARVSATYGAVNSINAHVYVNPIARQVADGTVIQAAFASDLMCGRVDNNEHGHFQKKCFMTAGNSNTRFHSHPEGLAEVTFDNCVVKVRRGHDLERLVTLSRTGNVQLLNVTSNGWITTTHSLLPAFVYLRWISNMCALNDDASAANAVV